MAINKPPIGSSKFVEISAKKSKIFHLLNILIVFNKLDLSKDESVKSYISQYNQGFCEISASKKIGIDNLKDEVLRRLNLDFEHYQNDAIINNTRHRHIIDDALKLILPWQSQLCSDESLPLECFAQDLRHAADLLADILGPLDHNLVLDKIFKDFCIGK